MENRDLAIIGLLQVVIVIGGVLAVHAGARGFDSHARAELPFSFRATQSVGLWALAIPLLWFGLAMLRERQGMQLWERLTWRIGGGIVLLVLALFYAGALLTPFIPIL